MPKNLFSLEVEKHVLGGLMKHPKLFAELDGVLKEEDFHNELNKNIFCIIRNQLRNNNPVDKVIVSEKVKNLNLSFNDDLNPYVYIDSLSYVQIEKKALFQLVKDLSKIRIRREFADLGNKIKSLQQENAEKSFNEIVAEVDSEVSKKILSYYLDEEPQNLFEGIGSFIEELGNNPLDEVGIKTPFPQFNELYGGLKARNIYAVVSRPGHGKSTFLFNLGFKACRLTNFKTKFLLLDTEMDSQDIKLRAVASITGVSMWELETGNWRRDPDKTKLVRQALKEMSGWEVFHKNVGNKPIDEIISIVKRWHYMHFGRETKGNEAIIAYDYIKLTGEKISDSWKEYQSLGDKVDKIKKLAEEINAPILTACQMNRSGESHNRRAGTFLDDSAAIAQTDRLQWFATFVGIFRRKTPDERQLDGDHYGTHKLIPIKTRFQGRKAAGHDDLVKRKLANDDIVYEHNYLNFEVNNFDITEKGTLLDIVEESYEDDGRLMTQEEEQRAKEEDKAKNASKANPK